MKSLTMIVGRDIQVWVDGKSILTRSVLEESQGWSFDYTHGLDYIGFKYPLDEFHQGSNPDEIQINIHSQFYILRVDLVFTPTGEQNITVHGTTIPLDETQTLIQATIK